MKHYKVSNLTTHTPSDQQQKLATSLRAIEGVDSVKLHPDTNEVSLEFRTKQPPQREVVAAAIKKSGFSMAQKP